MNKIKRDESGAVVALGLAVSLILFMLAAGFGLWAYTSRQDYKDNVDKKIADAVVVAQRLEDTKKDNEFLEREKAPNKNYTGPEAYGSLSVNYPKTWSALVTEAGDNSIPVTGYFHPNFVPGVGVGSGGASSKSVAFALRLSVISGAYSATLKTFDAAVTAGKIKVTPYKPEKVPSVVGVRLDGEIISGKQGSMVILPLRDKTIEVWTEAAQFVTDFNTTILPSLTFIP